MAEEKRDSALLTPSQREALQEENDISERGLRSARARIRNRIENTLLDFQLIFDHLDEDDRDKILQDTDAGQWKLHEGMVSAVALFYEFHTVEGWPFDELLERSYERVYSDSSRSPEPMIVESFSHDVDLKPQESRMRTFEAAKEKILNDDEEKLTDREFRVAVEHGSIEIDRWLEGLRERQRERRKERRQDETWEKAQTNAALFGDDWGESVDEDSEDTDEE